MPLEVSEGQPAEVPFVLKERPLHGRVPEPETRRDRLIRQIA